VGAGVVEYCIAPQRECCMSSTMCLNVPRETQTERQADKGHSYGNYFAQERMRNDPSFINRKLKHEKQIKERKSSP